MSQSKQSKHPDEAELWLREHDPDLQQQPSAPRERSHVPKGDPSNPDAAIYADRVAGILLEAGEEWRSFKEIAEQLDLSDDDLADTLAYLEENWPETSDFAFERKGSRDRLVLRKPASKRAFLEVQGSEEGFTGDEAEVFGVSGYDEPAGTRDGLALGPRDTSRVVDREQWDRDYERQRSKRPDRKADRHKSRKRDAS